MTVHAAVVLAAGGSTRLGRPKQLLTRDGEPLVRRAARLACETDAARVLLATGAAHASIAAACAGLPVEIVHNAQWARGLASSIACAAAALRAHTGPVLLLGCDQPALTGEHLHTLRACARTAGSGCAATRHGKRHGVPAWVSPAVFAQARVLQGDRGFGATLDALDAIALLDAPELTFDIDTPDDVARAVARGWLDAPDRS